ncbi:cytochrome P450 6k1-like [Belonocnema kinseyi]|uniref:cytochrome P450 6k1-like n=1 Tax=Belonocnema kinseyi TaxID=2817044 RepID=UPI00143DC3FC|nr:cytochrome P450 6k1-like [Belonocnema kinseyi]
MGLLTLSWLTDGTMLLLTIIIAAYFYVTRNFQYWKKRGVFEIPPVPFFGNFAKYCTFQMSPAHLFKKLYDQGENFPYVGIYIFDKPYLLLRDPEIIKRVLVQDFHIFSDKLSHSSKNDNISNKCLFYIDNPYWKYIRPKFSNLFSGAKLKSLVENVQDVLTDFNNHMDLLKLEGSGKKVDIRDLTDKFTLDVIGLAAFGLKLNSLRDPDAQFRKFARMMFGYDNLRRAIELTCVSVAPQLATLFDFRFFEKHSAGFLRKTFEEILDERKAKKIKNNDLIDLLIQLRDNDEISDDSHGFKFEGDNLLAQALIFFAAGSDTSSSAISFTLYELAKNLDIQIKLRNEINAAIEKNNKNLSYKMITNLQYLDMVIAETLRMYTTIPVIDRKATKDYKIEETGLIIEKGTPILIPTFGLHYDPKYYSNPNVYDPENFSDFNKSSRNPNVYLPFGIGPRNCIGMRQGVLQSKLGVALIISRFEVTLLQDTSVELNPKSYFTSMKGRLFLNIRKIDTNKSN